MSELEPVTELSDSDIRPVSMLAYQKEIADRITNVVRWLFRGAYPNVKLAGYLIYGKPGTGKTEIAKQVARQTKQSYPETKILFVDGSDIAAPRWGDAEKRIKAIFEVPKQTEERRIIIFDDIESLLLSRSADIAKEWHFSINSVLFHSLDFLDTTKCVVLATTNRIDLVDEALKNRLRLVKVDNVPADALIDLTKNTILTIDGLNQEVKMNLINKVKIKIETGKITTIREAMSEITENLFSYLEGESN